MQLDPKKFKPDESRSNPLAMAMSYPDCPINQICFIVITMGLGGIQSKCEYFRDKGSYPECLYDKTKTEVIK